MKIISISINLDTCRVVLISSKLKWKKVERTKVSLKHYENKSESSFPTFSIDLIYFSRLNYLDPFF